MEDVYIFAGQRIRELREKQHLTRDCLAELANISPKFLYEIEYGYKGFSAHTLRKLANALSTDSNYILEGHAKTNESENLNEVLLLFDKRQLDELQKILITIYALLNKT